MPNYRRIRAPGATTFFTVCLADRSAAHLTDRVGALRSAFAEVQRDMPFRIEAIVVLPDHLHAIWTLPPGDADNATRWKRIKAGFSKRTGLAGPISPSKRAKGEVGLWQRRFWDHVVRDERDFEAHRAYVWQNPVRHGLVARATDWPHSSIHREIRQGRFRAEWLDGPLEGEFGEAA